MDKSTWEFGEVIRNPDSEKENTQEIVPVEIDSVNSEDEIEDIQSDVGTLPNSSNFSPQITKSLGALMQTFSSISIKSTASGARFLKTPIYTMVGDTFRMKDNIDELTDKTHKDLFSSSFTGKGMMEDPDILMLGNNIHVIRYTGTGDQNVSFFNSEDSPRKVAEIESTRSNKEYSNGLQGERMKIFIPFNIIDICIRLEVLLGFKLFDDTHTLTEANKLIDELYRKGERQKTTTISKCSW